MMSGLEEFLSSPALIALVSGLVTGGFTLLATRREAGASRALERHRFRYEIGRMAAERRLLAYIELAAKLATAYRKKTTTDWEKKEWVTPLHDAKNFYYDNRFFFSSRLGLRFRDVASSLGLEHPKKELLEQHLNEFFSVVRTDLLLEDLEHSAYRAIKAAVGRDTDSSRPGSQVPLAVDSFRA